MNSKTDMRADDGSDAATRNLDVLKWVVVAALLAVGLYGYHYFATYSIVLRAVAVVVVAALALLVAFFTSQGAACAGLMRESLVEVRRVVWPTRQETTQTTLVVVGVVIVMAFVLWGLDAAFAKLISLVIG